jgi:hypothetical protein
LQEDRSHLKAKIETIENHVHVLESNVVSSQQVAALQERLVKDLSEGKTATVVAEDVAAVSLSPPLDIAKHTLFQRPATHKGDQPRAAAAAAAVAAAAAAANAPATRAAGEEGADMTWHARAMLLAAGASGVAAATGASESFECLFRQNFTEIYANLRCALLTLTRFVLVSFHAFVCSVLS